MVLTAAPSSNPIPSQFVHFNVGPGPAPNSHLSAASYSGPDLDLGSNFVPGVDSIFIPFSISVRSTAAEKMSNEAPTLKYVAFKTQGTGFDPDRKWNQR
ncbi:hypothetical protein EVAR_30627_1 [Eumeta japonica]|uniref:Uncharacterized protein n=1 Tax=Eumeta variegata TaxID=151549 RepID=A0A4C1WBL1_EUMVA|nr:hypothetical protein EVAR_30627_1 [Eumeta japonica]